MTEPLPDKPYLDERGDLVIPFTCADNRYKYWKKEGLPLADILEEVGASDEIAARYLPPSLSGRAGEG